MGGSSGIVKHALFNRVPKLWHHKNLFGEFLNYFALARNVMKQSNITLSSYRKSIYSDGHISAHTYIQLVFNIWSFWTLFLMLFRKMKIYFWEIPQKDFWWRHTSPLYRSICLDARRISCQVYTNHANNQK